MTRSTLGNLTRSPWPALLGAALLPALAAPAAAQERLAVERVGPSVTIDGFRSLAWGTTETEIVELLGEPLERRQLDSGLRLLAYRDSLVGHPSLLLFGLLEGDGLAKAQEVIGVEPGDACIATIREIHHQVDLQYPLIRPRAQAKNNTPGTVCDAAPQGLAYWHRQWRDEETGSVVTVSLTSGSDEIDLIYESGRFREWTAARGGDETPIVEDDGSPDAVLQAQP